MYPYPPRRTQEEEPTMRDLRGVPSQQRPPVDAAMLDEPTSEVPVITPAAATTVTDAGERPADEPGGAPAAEVDNATEVDTEIEVDTEAEMDTEAEVDAEADDTEPALEAEAADQHDEAGDGEDPAGGTPPEAAGDSLDTAIDASTDTSTDTSTDADENPSAAVAAAVPETETETEPVVQTPEPADALETPDEIGAAADGPYGRPDVPAQRPPVTPATYPPVVAPFGSPPATVAVTTEPDALTAPTALTESETMPEPETMPEQTVPEPTVSDQQNIAEPGLPGEPGARNGFGDPPEPDLPEPTPHQPDGAAETPIALWSDASADRMREQWRDLQVRFIDDPAAAVAGAKALVTDAVQELADTLLAAQDELDPFRGAENADTEAMRLAMRRYREFLDRVLAL